MQARLDYLSNPSRPSAVKHIATAGKVAPGVDAAGRDAGTGEAPRQPDQRLRLLHRHAHQGRRARRGDASRLHLVAAWREATVFTDAERAALELAEQGTRIADAAGGVPDEVWANAAKHYDEDQLAALVSLIALINAFNRLNVIVQQPAGRLPGPASSADPDPSRLEPRPERPGPAVHAP